MAELSAKEIEDVLWAYRDRVVDLKRDLRFRYILVFKNHGEAAGASLEHPHSQLIATPIIPIMVAEELDGAARLDQAYEERAAQRSAQQREDRALGAGRVLPRYRRRPLEERLEELTERARRHFAARIEATDPPRRVGPPKKRGRKSTFANDEERRAHWLAYWREYHRRRREESKRLRAEMRAQHAAAPAPVPVGRSPELAARLVPVVLGRGAHHGGTADVDVLDGVLQRAARAGDRGLEGVEVDHHDIHQDIR